MQSSICYIISTCITILNIPLYGKNLIKRVRTYNYVENDSLINADVKMIRFIGKNRPMNF